MFNFYLESANKKTSLAVEKATASLKCKKSKQKKSGIYLLQTMVV